MELSNIHYSTSCQSCGYIVEITQDIIHQEEVECDACGRHISLWELPDKTLVRKIMEIRKNELYVLWEQKKREYDEFSKVLQDLKNKLDCLNYPYEFIFLRQSRKEDLQDRIAALEPQVAAIKCTTEDICNHYAGIKNRLNRL